MRNKGVREVTRILLPASAEQPQLTQLRRALLSWFAARKRDLPWRRTRDPYAIWLSEIMLQQTRVAAVVPYFEKFIARFPTVRELAAAPTDDVLRFWAGLGYYSRARNLQRAAQEIVAAHHGEFPRDYEDALALPGIGRYTAAAVLSIAYGQPHAVLDGNVARVLARLSAMRGDVRAPARWQELQHHADLFLASATPGDWNQAMMELGATICTPRAPRCSECPLATACIARKLNITHEIPEKRRKRSPVKIQIAAAVLLDPRGRTLLVQARPRTTNAAPSSEISTLFSHMWRFPAIPVRRHARAELASHLREVFDIHIDANPAAQLQPLPKARHCVTFRQITLAPFLLRVADLPRLPQSTRPLLANLAARGNSPAAGPAANAVRTISNATKKIATAAFRTVHNSQTSSVAAANGSAPKRSA